MIQIELNGKTRLITLQEFLERNLQDILADDLGFDDEDPLSDFYLSNNVDFLDIEE